MKRLLTLALVIFLCAPAQAQSATATLTWTDNATNELTYRVERATGNCSGTPTFAEIATLPANTVTYVDTTAATNTWYCYRVRAVNNSGFSGYSNTYPFGPPNDPSNLVVQ